MTGGNLDAVILKSVVKAADDLGLLTASKISASADAYALSALRTAIQKNALIEDKVRTRTVICAYHSTAQLVAETHGQRFRADLCANPFQAPHSLAWYFNSMPLDGNIKAFVADLNKNSCRVWSVAKADFGGWSILAQSLIPQDQYSAREVAMTETARASRVLTNFSVSEIADGSGALSAASDFDSSSFFEVKLKAEAVRVVNRQADGAHADYRGRIPLRSEWPQKK